MKDDYLFDNYLEQLDRQTLKWGIDNQKKLYDYKVAVVGGGLIAEETLGCLAGMGIGNIVIMDNKPPKEMKKSFLYKKGNNKVKSTAETLKRINPYIKIMPFETCFSETHLHLLNYKPDTIIETTNDPYKKQRVLEYCKSNDIKMISGCSDRLKSFVSQYNPKKGINNLENILNLEGIEAIDETFQGPVPSGIASGIIAETIKNHAINEPNKENNEINKKIKYNLKSKNITSFDSDIDKISYNIKNKNILVAAGGAIGTGVALGLALHGFKKATILDMDKIEKSNLIRQILYYDKLGEKKSVALSQRMKEIARTCGFKNTEYTPFNHKLALNDHNHFRKNKYDLILGGFDNNNARFALNQYARVMGIPYIDGGTSFNEGSVSTYIPGKTPCMKCIKGLKLEKEIDRENSCAFQTPSIIIPNLIVGKLMVGEAIKLLSGDFVRNERIYYMDSDKDRFFLEKNSKKNPRCKC